MVVLAENGPELRESISGELLHYFGPDEIDDLMLDEVVPDDEMQCLVFLLCAPLQLELPKSKEQLGEELLVPLAVGIKLIAPYCAAVYLVVSCQDADLPILKLQILKVDRVIYDVLKEEDVPIVLETVGLCGCGWL